MTKRETGSRAHVALRRCEDTERQTPAPEISRSWQRCWNLGLDRRAVPEDAIVSGQELKTTRQAKRLLMRLARPDLELLSGQIAGTNFMCALADENGTVLDTIMDSEFADSPCAHSVSAGSIWREDIRGTNALGLALCTGRTSMVTGAEHYFDCHSEVSCVATPIFASDGCIVGLLDASSEVSERQFHTRALVNLSATSIENRLFVETHKRDSILQFHPRDEYLATQSVGLVAFDEAGQITGANRNAGRFLTGLGSLTAGRFGNLFVQDFQTVLRKLSVDDTVQLRDRVGSGFFARLHPASQRQPTRIPSSMTPSIAPLVRRIEPRAQSPILDDELARECARIAVKATGLGHPILLRGASGTGKTTLAQWLHGRLHPGKSLIAIDCRRLKGRRNRAILAEAVAGEVGIDVAAGSTLVLENMPAPDTRAAEDVDRLLDDLRDAITQASWSVTAIDRAPPVDKAARVVNRAGVEFLAIDLPRLADRLDFAKIARHFLADLSVTHQLSTRALRALSKIDRPGNMRDLRQHLKVLVASCPAGVIREPEVNRIFPPQGDRARGCERCDGVPIRRQRCIEIRQTYRACQGNVALTARRLGVSRNTVYAHLKG